MPTSKDAWGIEVGANAIKAVRLQQAGNSAELVDFEIIPFKKILTTPELNVDEAIRVGLDELLGKQRIGKSTVVVSLPGHAVLARSAKLPPVEPKRIGQIVGFEARQQIPFPIEQVEWDYQTFQVEDSPDVEVGIFAVTKQRLTPWLQNFQAVGLPVHGVAPSLAAVYNALSYDRDLTAESGGTVLMDIGTQSTDLIICEGHRFWPRTIPIGGNHFTEALVKSFKLSFSKAEKLKREASTSKYARQIFQAMRPVFVDLVQEVQKSLGYYQSLNRDADLQRLIGMGSTFRLPGLQTFLKQQLQIEIQRLDEFKKIEAGGKDVSTFGDNVISLAPAYGLALQGLEMERVSANLLPDPIIRRQMWQGKRPWFVAAAAVMLIGTLLAYGNLWRQKASYASPENQRAQRQVADVIRDARAAVTQWDEAKDANDPRSRIANVSGMLAYRQLWGWVIRDLDRALMTLDPQEAILTGDPGALEAIPRHQRRVFYVERLSAEYIYASAADEEARGTRRARERRADGQVDWEVAPPRFRLTLVGTTPYNPETGPDTNNPVGFINRTLNDALREITADGGRPYRTARTGRGNTPAVSITNRETVPDTGETGRDTGRTDPRRRDGFGGFGGFGETPDAPDPDPTATDLEAEKLTPKPFPGEQVQAGDTRITIEWIIELRPPQAMIETAETEEAAPADTEAETEAEAKATPDPDAPNTEARS